MILEISWQLKLCFSSIIEVSHGETSSLLDIKWLQDLGFRNVILELDAKVVVDSFHPSKEL